MSKTIKRSFIAGEVSPVLSASNELERYQEGLAKCENWMVDGLDGIKNCPGTEYIDDCYNTEELSRLIAFKFNKVQNYMLEFGDSRFRVMKDGTLILRDLVDAAYKWTESVAKPGEYHLELAVGGDPGILEPSQLKEDGVIMDIGTVGSLSEGEWDWADNDTLGYSTPYVKIIGGGDPDSKAQGYLQAPYSFTSPYPIADVDSLDARTQSADTLFIFHGDYAPRKLTRTSDTAWTITAITSIDGPYKARVSGDEDVRINITFVSGTTWDFKADTAIFGDVEVGECIRLGFPIPGDLSALYWSWYIVDTVTDSQNIRATQQEDTRPVYQQILNPFFEAGNKFWEETTVVAGAGSLSYDFTNQRAVLTDDGTNDAKMEQAVLTFANTNHRLIVNIAALTGATPTVTIKVGTTSGASDIFSSGAITTTGLKSYSILNTAETVYVSFDTAGSAASDTVEIDQVEMFASNDEPAAGAEHNTTDWRLAAWNSTHGYPQHGIIHEQRLIPARNYAEPQTLWPSVTGNFENYGFNTPFIATDSFSFNPPTPELNGIEWMALQNGLNVGTAGEVWKVYASSGGVITPTDVNIKIDSNIGALQGVQPLTIGNAIIHTPRGKAAVSEILTSYEAQGYVSRSLTRLAGHFFGDRRIIKWAYAQEPDSVIWCVMDDGSMLGLTYVQDDDVWAWWKRTTLLGEGFKDVAVIPNSNDDNVTDVYFIVNRSAAGQTPNYYLEKLSRRITKLVEYDVSESGDPPSYVSPYNQSLPGTEYDYRFLDSAATLDDPKTISDISQATPTVITITAHGFSNGDQIRINNVIGYIDLNNNVYEVSDKTANNFKIKDIDTGAYIGVPAAAGLIISGGQARKMVTVISGLDHLEGNSVTALADGAVREQLTVSSGSITLPQSASYAHIGLPYNSVAETLDIETIFQTGSSQGILKGLTKIDIYFTDSRDLQVYTQNRSGTSRNLLFEDEAYGDDPPPLFNGSKEKHLVSNYRKTERLFMKQTRPLPVHIRRIIFDVDYAG